MDFRPIFLVIGILLATLALVMLVPAAVDAFSGHPDWEVFAISSGVTLFVGVAMALTSRAGAMKLTLRQAFAMTTLSWLAMTFFASVPFLYSDLELSFTDAFFEAMSGLTTTGSTVITGLEKAPPGILIWRALLQWLGGIGIIVMAIAVLPLLKVGGMQLFRMESSDQSEKALPRAAQVATAIGVIYLLLSGLCAGAYWLAGMSGFDVLEEIKKDSVLDDLTVVIVTAKDLTQPEQDFLRNRTQAIFQKGVSSSQEVLSKLKTLLSRIDSEVKV